LNIGDVFLALHADGSKFQAEAVSQAQKAGDAAGTTLGSRIGSAATIAFRGGLALLSAGAAIATRGLVELDDAVAQFTADTGASKVEADAAGKAILAMSAKNIQPIKEIGATLGAVVNALGLTGDAAAAMTQTFLTFARATGQDATEAVQSFKGILDAWGLTAADSAGLMDKLVFSHQKYGTVISEDEDALHNLAPAMKALNFNIDDTIGLLDLFKQAGLDATTTQRAFNTAVKNLPSGTNLQDVIDRLSRIVDPALRAKAAIDIFGSRGGVALSNALAPGNKALQDYVRELVGLPPLTQEAAAAIDSTFGARIQIMLKGFAARLVEIGQNFGPLLSGFGALATGLGALGLDRLLVRAWQAVGGSALVQGAAAAAGSVVGAVFGAAAAGAELLTELAADAWEKITESTAVKSAAAVAGSVVGSIFGAAAAATETLIDGFTAAFTALPFAGTVRAAVLASAIELGTLSGSTFGIAFGKAATVGVILGIPLLLGEASKRIQDFIAGPGFHRIGIEDVLKDPFAPVDPNGNPIVQGAKAVGTAAGTALRDGFDKTNTYPAGTVLGPLTTAVKAETPALQGAWDAVKRAVVDYKLVQGKALDDALAKEESFASGSLAALRKFRTDLEDAFSGAKNASLDFSDTQLAIAEKQAELTALDKAHTAALKTETKLQTEEYRNRRIHILAEMQELKLHLALIGDDTHKVTALNALLTSKDMASGLTSKNAEVKAAYEDLRDKTIQALVELKNKGGPAGNAAAKDLAKYFNSSNPNSPLHNMKRWGSAALAAYLAGLTTLTVAQERELYGTVAQLAKPFTATSPPGPDSPLHLIDIWGERTIGAYLDGMLRKLKDAAGTGLRIASAVADGLNGPIVTPAFAGVTSPEVRATGLARAQQVASSNAAKGLATAGAHVGGDTFVTNLHMPAPPTRDPFEAIERAGFYQRSGILNPRLRAT